MRENNGVMREKLKKREKREEQYTACPCSWPGREPGLGLAGLAAWLGGREAARGQ